MQTSLCLLTLEVYYRHLPLYYRDVGEERKWPPSSCRLWPAWRSRRL